MENAFNSPLFFFKQMNGRKNRFSNLSNDHIQAIKDLEQIHREATRQKKVIKVSFHGTIMVSDAEGLRFYSKGRVRPIEAVEEEAIYKFRNRFHDYVVPIVDYD